VDLPARATDRAIAGGLALLAAVLHAPLVFRTVGGCDEWHILTAGVRLAAGEVMYRDVTHIAGPGSFYLAAALFRLFGARFEVARLTMLAVFATMTAVLYLLTRRLTGRAAAALVALWFIAFQLWCMPHWQMMHYASLGLFLVTCAFLVLGAERPPRAGRAVVAGLLAGAAMLTKQDSGALGTSGCLLALALGSAARRRAGAPRESHAVLLFFAAAAAAPLVVAVAYFWSQRALWPFVLQTAYDTLVQHPLFVGGGGPERVDYVPFPRLFPLLHQDALLRGRLLSYLPGMFWDLHWREVVASRLYHDTNLLELAIKLGFRLPYVLLLVEAIATARAWRRAGDGALAARAAQLAFAACIMAALSKPRDWIHLSIVIVPLAPIVARQLGALDAALPRIPRDVVRSALVAVGALYLGLSADLGWRAVVTYTAPIHGTRGTAYARAGDAETLQDLVAALEATPANRPVMAVPCVSAATFLAARPCASRFPWLWPRDAYRDRDQQVLASLDAHPDATVVYTLSHIPTIPRLQGHGPALFEGLATRYRMGPIFGPDSVHLIATLAERRPASPERDALRLTDRLAAATVERIHGGTVERIDTPDALAGVATWALTPRVLWVAPSAGGETHVALPVRVPPGARLRLRAGVNPDLWQTLGPFPVRLRVAVVADGQTTELLAVQRDVFAHPGDRAWVPLDADLSAFAGREVTIVLAAAADGWPGSTGEVAGFEDPRVVRP